MTPKSTREKIYRKLRLKKIEPKHRTMVGRVVPKHQGNNDPTRGKYRLHNESELPENITEAITFMSENYGKEKKELIIALDSFQYKQIMKNIADHMTAVRLGGWKLVDGRFVNESGRTASPKNWKLKEGRLVTKRSNALLEYDIDWLLTLSECCE